jgi:hypothetical protein
VLNPDGRACAAYRDPLCLKKTQLLRATEIAVLTVDQPEIRAQSAVTKSEFMTPDGEMVFVVTSLAAQVRSIAGPEVAHVRSIWRVFHCAMSEPK